MSHEAIASRYAQALFEIGVENRNLAKLTDEVGAFAVAYEASEELRSVMDNPLIPDKQREAVLVELAQRLNLSEVVKNSIRLLIHRRRLTVLPALAQALRKMSDDKEGVLRVTVTSAKPLGESYARRLQAELEKMTGKKIMLTREVDASLIAGVVTRVGDTVIDGSLRTRLDELREDLLAD